jgi:hypothetical protein
VDNRRDPAANASLSVSPGARPVRPRMGRTLPNRHCAYGSMTAGPAAVPRRRQQQASGRQAPGCPCDSAVAGRSITGRPRASLSQGLVWLPIALSGAGGTITGRGWVFVLAAVFFGSATRTHDAGTGAVITAVVGFIMWLVSVWLTPFRRCRTCKALAARPDSCRPGHNGRARPAPAPGGTAVQRHHVLRQQPDPRRGPRREGPVSPQSAPALSVR